MSKPRTTGDPLSRMREKPGESLMQPCNRLREAVVAAELASNAEKKAICLESVLKVEAVVVAEATELASSVVRKATCQENVLREEEVVAEATEHASSAEKKATCRENAQILEKDPSLEDQ